MSNPQRIQATVQQILDHGDGVYTVRFDVPPRATRFKPGQFLHLTLDDFDPAEAYWPTSRVFSIASRPRDGNLEIVYSVKGEYTIRMSRELQAGKSVWLKLPYGDFIVENHVRGKDEAVFVAGGTGISPFIPYFLEREADSSDLPITLYYGVRDTSRFLYREVVERLHRSEHAKVSIWSEREGSIPPFEARRGRFDLEVIRREILAKTNTVCFLSGPPQMIKAFQTSLKEAGFPLENVIVDEWE